MGAINASGLEPRPLIEDTVICTQDAIGQLAVRIEQAYGRRYPKWSGIGLTPGVWESASARLIEASRRDPDIPVDPELFVAVQRRSRFAPDPWSELTQAGAVDCYSKSLRRIVGQLRRELKRELRRAEARLGTGLGLDEVIVREGTRLSPLARYILNYRAGRVDFSGAQINAVLRQHRSCPLYRIASRSLLPGHAYPTPVLERDASSMSHAREILAFSVN